MKNTAALLLFPAAGTMMIRGRGTALFSFAAFALKMLDLNKYDVTIIYISYIT